VDDLPPWRPLLVTGEAQGQAVAEAVTLDHVEPLGSRSRLVLTAALKHVYKRDTVRILANVARASHGESVSQILGSGDAGRAHQRFELKHAPVTFLGAENETGARSTLALRVNDVAWQEAATLFDAMADSRAYTLRSEQDGRSHVQFGDGRRGARLPSGQENVRVRYRKGLGAAGNVAVGQLSQLMTRPLGLKSASNPLPAEGGTDPEPEAQARQSMPLGVRTLGRAVSVLDYEDFARGFAGIAKAQAAVLNLRAGRAVFVTIAGENGARPDANSPVRAKLIGALKRSGDPLTRFEVQPYDIAHFRLGLKIKRHPDHESKLVLAAVEQALRRSFSFEARALGQPVALSEVIAIIEQVSGVIATDIDRFYRGTIVKREARLFARRPHVTTAGVGLPAELLTLAPEPLDHLELRP
jgi:predicted phage baseplate assembly protein